MGTLFFMHLDIYKDLVYEFYNSLSVPLNEHSNIIGYTMSFKIRGEDHVIKPKKFVEWLDCDNERILNTPVGWTLDYLRRNMDGVGIYYSNMTKSTGFYRLIVRILHRIITYSLNGRKSTNGHVSMRDMVLLKATIDGFQVDTAK